MSNEKVQHPWISCWTGERGWTPDGEPQSEFISFDTDNDAEPFRIAHNRDMMFNHGGLEQDYNFIDYFFGDADDPIHARYYLKDDHVSVDLPKAGRVQTLNDAQSAFPTDALAYLQKRFLRIDVLVAEGYTEFWRHHD